MHLRDSGSPLEERRGGHRDAAGPDRPDEGGTLTDHAAYSFRAYPFPDDAEDRPFRWFVVLEPDDPDEDLFRGGSVRLRLSPEAGAEEARALADHLNRRVDAVHRDEGAAPGS